MIFYKLRKKVKNFFLENFIFLKIIIRSSFTKPKSKLIYFEITDLALNRYLYNLIKFFKLNGYTVYIPRDKKMLSNLSKNKGEFRFASWILNEGIKIGKPPSGDDVFFLNKEKLSNDYFNLNNLELLSNVYHIPMSQFPYMYNTPVNNDTADLAFKRKKSIFMCGNLSPIYYTNISSKGVFDIISRREVVDYIYGKNYYYKISSYINLLDYFNSTIDFKVLLIDSTTEFHIELNKLKFVLKQFDFFLALPGILIPHSHNLIEAMEMGCIPVIHKCYAQLMYPNLVHLETAIVYEDIIELDKFIRYVFEMDEDKVINLRKNVLQYYEKYLTPKAVVDIIINNNFDKILIQAEHISVDLLNNIVKTA